jgi:type II secretory pathway component PulF
MSSYHYKAIDDSGHVVKGVIPAFTEFDIEQQLQRRGLFLIQSTVRRESLWSKLFARRTINSKLLIEFYYRFAQTLEIGLPIITTLEEIGHFLPSALFKRIIEEIKLSIEGGSSLVEAMGKYPRVFQPIDSALVGMGEKAGVLPKCLKDLAGYHEWKAEIRSLFLKATLYPTFIIVAIAAVVGVWIGYVLPQMIGVLKELGVALPFVMGLLLEIRNLLRDQGLWLLGCFLMATIVVYTYQKTASGRLAFHRFLLKLPVLGSVVGNIALARLCHNFSTMLSAGMNINSILQILSDRILGNRYLEACLRSAHEEITRGESIAGGFEKAGGFPALLVGAIRHGENTGTMDDSLKRMGEFFDREVKRTVQILTNSIEPVAILTLGGVFGFIVLSIMLPLYDVLGDLGKAY